MRALRLALPHAIAVGCLTGTAFGGAAPVQAQVSFDATYGASMTYANREQRAYDRLLSSIGPLLVRIEQAFRFILPRGHAAYFDRSVLLWSDAQTRAYVQQTALNDGTLTINEARKANGLPLFDSWADRSSADPQAKAEEVAATQLVPT